MASSFWTTSSRYAAMNSKFSIQARINEMLCSQEAAKRLSAKDLAIQIKAIGFQCLRCGECCIGQDNSVVIFPFEIRGIIAETGYSWLEIAEPAREGECDCEGNFHTLEWRLCKDNGSCKFYGGGCRVYRTRPLLCKTYPFYLDDGALRWSDCRGLGEDMDYAKAEEIAALVLDRNIREIQEAIALLERYNDFERGASSKRGDCIVHDSEGEHRISQKAESKKA